MSGSWQSWRSSRRKISIPIFIRSMTSGQAGGVYEEDIICHQYSGGSWGGDRAAGTSAQSLP